MRSRIPCPQGMVLLRASLIPPDGGQCRSPTAKPAPSRGPGLGAPQGCLLCVSVPLPHAAVPRSPGFAAALASPACYLGCIYSARSQPSLHCPQDARSLSPSLASQESPGSLRRHFHGRKNLGSGARHRPPRTPCVFSPLRLQAGGRAVLGPLPSPGLLLGRREQRLWPLQPTL